MPTFTLTVQHDREGDYKGKASDSPVTTLQKVATFIQGLSGHVYGATSFTVSADAASGTVTLTDVGGTAASGSLLMSNVGGAAASGTITFSGSTGAWTATVNGVAFGRSSAGDDDAEGDYLATQILGDPTLSLILSAANDGGVVTITALAKGTAGNAYTLAVTGTGVTRSGATLTGGLQGSVGVTINGTLVTTNTTNLTDTNAAIAVAAAIEANGTLGPLVTVPVPVDENVDITWNVKGVVGNAVTFTSTTATGTTSPSGSGFLTLGADGSVTVTINGTAVVTDTTDMTSSEAATAVAAEIDADATASTYVDASASSNVVTVTATVAGNEGNAYTLSSTSDTGTATASSATLSGGSEDSYTL